MPRLRATFSLRAASLLVGATFLFLPPVPGSADSVSGLRRERAGLAAHERAALLELYALDSRLDAVRGKLGSLREQAAELERERAAARARLRAAQRTLEVAQLALGDELRALYEQAQPDPLAILLGATSLRGAIDGLDSLEHAAGATTTVIVQTRAARAEAARLATTLAARVREAQELEGEVASTAAALAEARAERAGYLDRLRSAQRLKAGQIAALELRAKAVEAKARLATVAATAGSSLASFGARVPLANGFSAARPEQQGAPAASAPADPSPPVAAPTEPTAPTPTPTAADRTIVVVSTGYSTPGITATGLPVGYGIVAVDPTVIPLGTRLTIPGYGGGIAADTGGAIKGARIDLWFPTQEQALAWGWQTLTVTLD